MLDNEDEKSWMKYISMVKKINFFKDQDLNNDDLQTVCQRLQIQEEPAGKEIFRYGYFGDSFYIILSGKVSVLVPKKKIKNENESSKKKSSQKRKFFAKNTMKT